MNTTSLQIRLDIPPDTDDDVDTTDVSTGQRVSVGDVPDDEGGTSATTWVLVGLVAVILVVAIIVAVTRRTSKG